MLGYRFSEFIPSEQEDGKKAKFDQLLDIFNQLITMTAGNVSEALSWITQLDKQYNLTDESYGIADFIQDLKDKGYIREEKNEDGQGQQILTAKGEQSIRQASPPPPPPPNARRQGLAVGSAVHSLRPGATPRHKNTVSTI